MRWSQRVWTFVLCLASAATSFAQTDAQEVMQNNFLATKVSGLRGDVTLTLIDARNEQRVRRMSIQSMLKSNGTDSSLITRFQQPSDIRGTGFLQNENSAGTDDIWVYLPALGKTRRLAANQKRDSFFGTDFAYGDILLPPLDQWRHTLVRNEALDGADCFVIESLPANDKTRSDSGYSRKLTWVDAKSYVERKVEYYDLRNQLLKTQTTSGIELVEPERQRWLARKREMVNHQSGHRTLYTVDRYEVTTQLTADSFTVRLLESG